MGLAVGRYDLETHRPHRKRAGPDGRSPIVLGDPCVALSNVNQSGPALSLSGANDWAATYEGLTRFGRQPQCARLAITRTAS